MLPIIGFILSIVICAKDIGIVDAAFPVSIYSTLKLPVENPVNVLNMDWNFVVTDAVSGLATRTFLLVTNDCKEAVYLTGVKSPAADSADVIGGVNVTFCKLNFIIPLFNHSGSINDEGVSKNTFSPPKSDE